MQYFHGGDLESYPSVTLDFSVSLNPFGMPEPVKEALRQSIEQPPRYPDPLCRSLRQALGAWEQADADLILCGSGASDLLYRYTAALRPGHALLLTPTFTEYNRALQTVNCAVDRYALLSEREFLPEEGLLTQITEELDLLILCSPNNPTGRLFPEALLRDVLKRCREKRVSLLIDECFLDFTEGISAVRLLGENPNMTVLKAFTKSFAIAGIRLGYCLSSDRELLRKMAQEGPPWAVSVTAQAAGIAACGESVFLEECRGKIRKLREELFCELTRLGLRVFPSDANFLLFQSKTPLFEALLQRGILIRNCGDFIGLTDDYYRVAIRTEEDNKTLIAALEEIL